MQQVSLATERASELTRQMLVYAGRGATEPKVLGHGGGGMTPQTRLKMSVPFFTTKPTGRGLGMAIVIGAVTGHCRKASGSRTRLAGNRTGAAAGPVGHGSSAPPSI